MVSSIWHYLKGYVIVEIRGANVEKFLSLCVYHQLILWNITKVNEIVRCSVSIEDFKAMKHDLKKTRSRIRIISKRGLPFILYKYRKRKVFMGGIILFIIMVCWLSSFVWLIDVEGIQRIQYADIVNTLKQNGYSVGKQKFQMNLRDAEAVLLKSYPDIVWVGIGYEGTRMVVKVSESVLPPEMMPTEQGITSIVAKRDALIEYIAVQKGKPVVKKGDIVKKGDLLVSGEMPLGEEDETPYYTSSKATVLGKTTYTLTQSLDLVQETKYYTNKVSKTYRFKFFNHSLTLFSNKPLMGASEKDIKLHQLKVTRLFPLPFGIEEEISKEYIPKYYRLTKEEAEETLISKLWDEIKVGISENATILNKEAIFREEGDKIVGTLYIIVQEEIGYKVDNQDIIDKGE